MMMRDFLSSYGNAVSLDDMSFPPNKQKADFLLFGNRVICEVKDICAVDIPAQVERVTKKGSPSSHDASRQVGRSIIAYLHDAARQIEGTRDVLGLPQGLGLVIMENHVPDTISSALLIAVADYEMQRAIPEIDGILCLDFVNAFTRSDGDSIRLAQLVCRPGDRSEKLARLTDRLRVDFLKQANIPGRTGYAIEKLEQRWVTDQHGKFQRYEAKVDFPASERRPDTPQRILRFIARWAIVFGLAWVLLVWLIRKFHLSGF